MKCALTEKEQEKVNVALKAAGFRNIKWAGDTVRCDHKSNKSPCDAVRKAGFFVPCGGVAYQPFCQVWHKGRYFSQLMRKLKL
jgi:hypothetical protein